MKKFITSIIAILVSTTMLLAQSPDMMSYQAVIRDNNNDLVANQAVGMQISILQGSSSGTAVYEETHTPTTNDNGLATIMIGNGTVVSGDITTIDWANGPYFIKTETDPTGGTNYSITGTSQLLSVPYALYAESSGNALWTENGGDVYYDNGQVGIGTNNPETDAHVGGELFVDDQIRINPNDNAAFGYSYLRFNEGDGRMYHEKADSSLNIRGFHLVDINDFQGYDAHLNVDGDVTNQGDIISSGADIVTDADDSENFSYYKFRSTAGSTPRIYHGQSGDFIAVSGITEFIVDDDFSVAGTKNFKIDHPADPENKYLYHAAIESDKRYNKYSGNITTDENGVAVVELPEYVQLVNKNFRYNLTVIGTFAQAIVGEEVSDNKFVIRTDEPNVKVSWELTGVRNDPYAKQNPYKVEVEKEENEAGRYLMPELYGQPKEKSLDYQKKKAKESKRKIIDKGPEKTKK